MDSISKKSLETREYEKSDRRLSIWFSWSDFFMPSQELIGSIREGRVTVHELQRRPLLIAYNLSSFFLRLFRVFLHPPLWIIILGRENCYWVWGWYVTLVWTVLCNMCRWMVWNYIVICCASRPMRIRGKTTYSKYKKSYFWQIVPVYDIAQKSNKNYPWKFFIVLLSSSLFKSYIPHADKRAREPRSAEESSQKPKKKHEMCLLSFLSEFGFTGGFPAFQKEEWCVCVRACSPSSQSSPIDIPKWHSWIGPWNIALLFFFLLLFLLLFPMLFFFFSSRRIYTSLSKVGEKKENLALDFGSRQYWDAETSCI